MESKKRKLAIKAKFLWAASLNLEAGSGTWAHYDASGKMVDCGFVSLIYDGGVVRKSATEIRNEE